MCIFNFRLNNILFLAVLKFVPHVEISFFFPDLLRYNWHITLCKFKVYSVVILYVYILHNDYPSEVINTFITWHSYKCFWWELLKSTLSNFQIYNTALFTMVSMLYITSSEFIHLLTGCLHPLTTFTHFPYPVPPLKATNLSSVSVSLFFSDSTYKWDYIACVFLWFISLSIMPSRFIHVVTNGRISFFFMTE